SLSTHQQRSIDKNYGVNDESADRRLRIAGVRYGKISTAARSHFSICRFDHHGGITIPAIVIACRSCGFDLIVTHSLARHVLNTIADDRNHVSILDDVSLICNAAVTWDDHRAALLPVFRDGQIDNSVPPRAHR